MSWLDQFFTGNAGATGPSGPPSPSQYLWGTGVKGALAADFGSGYLELIYANTTGNPVTLKSVAVGIGSVALDADAVNPTEISVFQAPLGGETTTGIAAFDNTTVGLAAQADHALAISVATVPTGCGVYVGLNILGGAGTDLGPGLTVRIEF